MTDWGALATGVAAVGGLCTGITALAVSWSTRNQSKRQADETAAANEIARDALRVAEEANLPKVMWQLEAASGSEYLLTNVGSGVAWDVSVSHERLRAVGNKTSEDQLRQGEGLTLLVIEMWRQTDDPRMHVRWSDEPGGEQREWKQPLPQRPR